MRCAFSSLLTGLMLGSVLGLLSPLLSGCQDTQFKAGEASDGSATMTMPLVDAGPPRDLISPPAFGKYASELALDLTLTMGGDGGAPVSTGLKLFALWASGNEIDGGMANTIWLLCEVPIPELANVPLSALNTVSPSMAAITHENGVTHFSEPEVAIVAGASLTDNDNDLLPSDPNQLCHDQVTSGCILPDPNTEAPGVSVSTSGLTPDVDTISLDLRVKLGFDADLDWSGSLNGKVTAASFESHVLSCHLRNGGACSQSDLARIIALDPQVAFTGGTMRSRSQGTYFTCPVFLSDTEGALDEVNLDAGAPDLAAPDMALLSAPTFSNAIESDLDARGCATGGCHETFTKPGQMHLVFEPATSTLLKQNYQAVLPWTVGPPAGGLFVNQVPLPDDMRARWLDWIGGGAPF